MGVKGEGEPARPPGLMSSSRREAMLDMSDPEAEAELSRSRPRLEGLSSPPAAEAAVKEDEAEAEVKKPEPTRLGKKGVCAPDASPLAAPLPLPPGVWGTGGWSASREAWRRRLVVPRAFVWEERAEQTSATRELGM